MSKRIIHSKKAPSPIGPYSQAVLAGNVLYGSGQVALNPETGELINAGLELETRQVMENIGEVMQAAKMDFTHIVKCTIFLKNMDDFAKVNAVYGEYFEINPPARETVEVAKLPLDVNVEISFIAVKN